MRRVRDDSRVDVLGGALGRGATPAPAQVGVDQDLADVRVGVVGALDPAPVPVRLPEGRLGQVLGELGVAREDVGEGQEGGGRGWRRTPRSPRPTSSRRRAASSRCQTLGPSPIRCVHRMISSDRHPGDDGRPRAWTRSRRTFPPHPVECVCAGQRPPRRFVRMFPRVVHRLWVTVPRRGGASSTWPPHGVHRHPQGAFGGPWERVLRAPRVRRSALPGTCSGGQVHIVPRLAGDGACRGSEVSLGLDRAA